MSYALELAADPRRAMTALPIEVQEAAIDVLERVAADADPASPDVITVQHVVFRVDANVVFVRPHYTVDHARRMVTLERVIAIVGGVA